MRPNLPPLLRCPCRKMMMKIFSGFDFLLGIRVFVSRGEGGEDRFGEDEVKVGSMLLHYFTI